MSEVIVKLTSDRIKVKNGEYIQDIVRCGKCANKDEDYNYCNSLKRVINPDDFCSFYEVRDE